MALRRMVFALAGAAAVTLELLTPKRLLAARSLAFARDPRLGARHRVATSCSRFCTVATVTLPCIC